MMMYQFSLHFTSGQQSTSFRNQSLIQNQIQNRIQKIYETFQNRVEQVDFSSCCSGPISVSMIVNGDTDGILPLVKVDNNAKTDLFVSFQNGPVDNEQFVTKTILLRTKLSIMPVEEMPRGDTSVEDCPVNNIVFVFDFSQHACGKNNRKDHSGMGHTGSNKTDKDDTVTVFVPAKPRYKLDDVIMNESTRESIATALSILRHRDKIYREWGFQEVDTQSRSVIGFFGEPGTGKTMTAHGIAYEMGRPIIAVNYAEIESKWAGESPKNLISAFHAAEQHDAVLFFDEADSFLGKRITNVASGHDQAINSLRSQMLILLENFEGIVIFATNLVKNYDTAFQTRIQAQIEFEKPDEANRARLFQQMIPSRVPLAKPFVKEDYLQMATGSDGLVGRDIKNIVLDTLAKGARLEVESFSVECFMEAIENRKATIQKLKNDSDEGKIQNKLLELFEKKAKQEKGNALLTLGAHMAWADGAVKEQEETLLHETAEALQLPLFDLSSRDKLPSLSDAAAKFVTANEKARALDVVCRMAAIDGGITEEENRLLRQIIELMNCDQTQFDRLVSYMNHLVESNRQWKSLCDDIIVEETDSAGETDAVGGTDAVEKTDAVGERDSVGEKNSAGETYFVEGVTVCGGVSSLRTV